MTTLQIVLLSIISAIALTSVVFMVLFIVEISVSSKEEQEVEVKSIFSSENYVKQTTKEESVDSMLAKLDEQAQDGSKEEKKEEPKEEVQEEVQEEVVETVEETVETKEDVQVASRGDEFEVEEAPVEEVKNETQTVEVDAVAVEGEPITAANLLDYKARLASVIESRDKLNKDLIKIEKSILNYERTKRRKARNQKMLDRRASELTNLNLVMYSVTDIKNVDEEKKVKQEELTTHIAELKASIQDAEEFLDSNKEKNEHDIKMAKFLIQEKARFKEEIAELEALIAKTEGTDAAAV